MKSAINYLSNIEYEKPYEEAKYMLLVDNVDDKEYLSGLFDVMYDELPFKKTKKKIKNDI